MNSRVFYGWYMVGCGWIFFVFGYGFLFYAPLIFFEAWTDTFGWSRGVISGAYSLPLFTVAILSPVVGKMTDKYGAQPVMFLGTIILGIGIFLLRWISEPWHLYATLMVAAIGFALGVAVPVNALIARWFSSRRGIAVGITYTGAGAGGLIMIPLVDVFTSLFGWENTTAIIAVSVWAIQIPLSLFLIRSDPQSMGLTADGRYPEAVPKSGERIRERVPPFKPIEGVSLGHAVKTAKFWVAGLVMFIALASSFGTFTQTQPFLGDLGYSSEVTVILLSVNGGLVVVFKFLFGYFGDKVPIKTVMGVATLGAMLAPILMFSVVFLEAPRVMAMAIPLVLATSATAFNVIVPLVAASAFGLRHIGAVSGALGTFVLLGMAAGPATMGGLFALTGGYTVPSAIFGSCIFASLVILLKSPSLEGDSTSYITEASSVASLKGSQS